MLILRTDLDTEAPVAICDWPGCDWRKPIRIPAGGSWEVTVAGILEELDRHVAWTHVPKPVEPGWEVTVAWSAQEADPAEPERERGPAWEPFTAFPQARGDIPGIAVAWRRLREPEREDTAIIPAAAVESDHAPDVPPLREDADPGPSLPPEVISRPTR